MPGRLSITGTYGPMLKSTIKAICEVLSAGSPADSFGALQLPEHFDKVRPGAAPFCPISGFS